MRKSIKVLSILMMVLVLTMTVAAPVFASQVDVSSITPTYGDATSVVIAVLGVKYMMGSLEEKAEYKKSMIPLIVGIVVVMSASTIAKLLFDTFSIT